MSEALQNAANNLEGSQGSETVAEEVQTTPETEVTNESEGGGDSETSAADVLKSVEVDTIDDAKILDYFNNRGIIQDGLPMEFESIDQVEEYLSKGGNYTQKTQGLSEERKQMETEFAQEREAIETQRAEVDDYLNQAREQVLTSQILVPIIQRLANTDPDLFAEIDQEYTSQMNQYMQAGNNPVVQDLTNKLNGYEQKLQEIQNQHVQKEHAQIREGFEAEFQATKHQYVPQLRALKVPVNWKEVKDAWASDPHGKMSVEDALMAKYGKAILAAQQSQNKLTAEKLKNANRSVVEQESDLSLTEDEAKLGGFSKYEAIADRFRSKLKGA